MKSSILALTVLQLCFGRMENHDGDLWTYLYLQYAEDVRLFYNREGITGDALDDIYAAALLSGFGGRGHKYNREEMAKLGVNKVVIKYIYEIERGVDSYKTNGATHFDCLSGEGYLCRC